MGSSSRCDVPAAKKWNVPLCTPWVMRSVVFAPGSVMRPAVRSARRMSTQARQPRTA